ncbi:MAG: OmpA family protein [Desulfofustis sp.]|nr:OmpA family protein [Desulfofustis sp.]
MLHKLITVFFVSLVLSGTAFAIEPPAGATVPWIGNAPAYTSREFNALLEAYGLNLQPQAVAGIPSTYAAASGDSVVFNDTCMAYAPFDYHAILTAYGLTLNQETMEAKLGHLYYATMKNGTVVFGSIATVYTPSEWQKILSAYELAEAAQPAPQTQPAAVVPVGDSDGDGVPDDRDACPDTPKGIQVDERGCWSLSTVLLFDFDKAVIKTQYYYVLDQTQAVFNAYPNMQVRIDGHTCDIGSEQYNQGLSERRAQAVYDYLVNSIGIDSGRLSVVGYGETKPAYPNDSAINREKNRRVEFTPLK